MADYSDLLAGNPYFQPAPRSNLSTIGSMLANLGAGIAGAGSSGQPWMAGIAPGAAMASNAVAKQKEQDELEEARRFQMGLHLQQLKQLQDDRDLKNKGIAALVAANGGGPTPDANPSAVPGGGMNVQPNPVQMGPRAPVQGGGVNDNNIGNVRPPGASTGFQQPPDFDSGVGLTIANARSYPRTYNGGQPMTLAQIGAHWAPVGSADDPTGLNKNWVPNVAKLSGLDPNAPLDLNDPATATAFVRGIHGAEKGPQAMKSPEAYASGIAKGLPGFQIPGMPTPAGMAGASPMPSGGLPPGASIGLPPELAAPAASPVLPPYMPIPGMPSAPTPPVPTAGMPQQPTVVQGDSTSPTPQIIPAQYTPPPALPAPGAPPKVPRPTQLPPAEANVLNNLLMTRAITPEQFLAQKNKRLDEIHHDDQTAATEAWKQQNENYRFNRGLAEKADTYRPLTPPEARQLGLPENVQYQLNTKTNKVEPMSNTKQARFADITDTNGQIIGKRNLDTNEYHPVQPVVGAGLSIDPNLKGDEVYQALTDQGGGPKANEVRGIVEGRLPLPSAQSRIPDAILTRKLAFQADPSLTDATHAQRMKTLTDLNSGKPNTAGYQLQAQGTLYNHIAKALDLNQQINNSPYPLVNRALNAVGAGEGDPRLAAIRVTLGKVNAEGEKAFEGKTTVSGLAKAEQDLHDTMGTPAFAAAARAYIELVNGQQTQLLGRLNRGLGYKPGDQRALTLDNPEILTPDAKDSLARVLAQTQPNKADNSKLMDAGKQMLGAKAPEAPKQEAAPTTNYPTPSPGSIKALQMSPTRREEFDKMFGPGAAEKALGK